MKKLLSLVVIFAMLLSLVACSSNYGDGKELLLSVLNNEKSFLTENEELVFLKDYSFYARQDGNDELVLSTPTEYSFVDFDADGVFELVVNVSPKHEVYLVLHISEDNVYGFQFNHKDMQSLKADGSFAGGNGTNNRYYARLHFGEDYYSIFYIATYDSTANQFEINGERQIIISSATPKKQ